MKRRFQWCKNEYYLSSSFWLLYHFYSKIASPISPIIYIKTWKIEKFFLISILFGSYYGHTSRFWTEPTTGSCSTSWLKMAGLKLINDTLKRFKDRNKLCMNIELLNIPKESYFDEFGSTTDDHRMVRSGQITNKDPAYYI